MPQLSRRPGFGVHPSRGNDASEASADVGGIKWAAGGRREHEIVLRELASAFGTLLLDRIPVLREGFDAAGRQLQCAACLLVFVSPCARTDLQSSMVGGLPSRLTRDQVNARSSSVRAPMSSETTT
jgi:hypothetical protein